MPQEPRQPPFLTATAISDLTDLIDASGNIAHIVDACTTSDAATSVFRFSCRVADKVGLPPREVHDVLFGLLNIHRMRRGLDGEGIVNLLTESLQTFADEEWQADYLEEWKGLSHQIALAINSLNEQHPLVVSGSAENLATCQQNILISCRIVTDARSVFDSAGENILGTMISHSLSMHYSTGNHQDHATICIAMSPGDIDLLQAACVRAKKKKDALVERLSTVSPILLD